ncbi:putative DNA-binding protein [Yersinia pseudotuberculosis]|uniref:DNA-binding protein n=1 Tax=Yersinia pseudotuberculosis serotype O:3 (strain YPIII) TaxID=502800 RepID=A0A0H3B186_YERPY|nr:hypothetical protein [Yersinia pseudotuberculosis]AJJ60796.1 putative dNA-binding protein [Yersinia pseudotuberculosis YPIII]AYW86947.1 hypothetical protein EGX87_06965 [Yersinia pseudotuberculosis]MBK1425986.1 hypothetical protein [Yersinia pseudotuberculosis]SQA61765.1 putative DNA-binding protein [Yersinia pseudotuberculosis]
MPSNITISLTTPHVTKERYSELTGLSIRVIESMLDDGRLSTYRHRLKKDGGREIVLINLAALTIDAISSHEIKFSH